MMFTVCLSYLGSVPNNHFIRSNNPAARYHTCPESARQSVTLPYNGPQGVGHHYITQQCKPLLPFAMKEDVNALNTQNIPIN